MIFISHSSHDAKFVSELRTQLESFGLKTWVYARNVSTLKTMVNIKFTGIS